MTKTLTQDVFKDAPDWVRSAAVDENGHAFMNNYPKSDLSSEYQQLIGSE